MTERSGGTAPPFATEAAMALAYGLGNLSDGMPGTETMPPESGSTFETENSLAIFLTIGLSFGFGYLAS